MTLPRGKIFICGHLVIVKHWLSDVLVGMFYSSVCQKPFCNTQYFFVLNSIYIHVPIKLNKFNPVLFLVLFLFVPGAYCFRSLYLRLGVI